MGVGGVYSRGEGERENVGIIRRVNETGRGKKSTRKNQQSTMITSTSHSGLNHVYVMGRRRRQSDGMTKRADSLRERLCSRLSSLFYASALRQWCGYSVDTTSSFSNRGSATKGRVALQFTLKPLGGYGRVVVSGGLMSDSMVFFRPDSE